MVWFLHITQQPDGRWRCSHGRRQLDIHDELAEAVAHLREYARSLSGAAELMLHREDGRLERLGIEGLPD